MNTCRTCTHWDQDTEDEGEKIGWGFCRAITCTYGPYNPNERAALTSPAHLATREDFGCTEHTPKPHSEPMSPD